MGNSEYDKKKIPTLNKTQFEVACTKAKIHLELMRDRKNAEIIKGQRQLVAKLNSPSRNKLEELLIAERVTNGLKYAQACNQLAAYAASLKSHSNFIAENVANEQKIEPWLMHIFTLHFAADQMGLSSLNEFCRVVRSLYSPQSASKYCNKDIFVLLSPTPTPQQLNVYMVQMSERNSISLQKINIIGHKFTKQWDKPQQWDPQFLDLQRKLADQISHKMLNQCEQGKGGFSNGQGPNGQGFGDKRMNQSNQGGHGNGQKFIGNQGNIHNQGGFGNDPNKINKEEINPYKGLSSINNGPQYYQPNDVKPMNNEKPREFPSWQQMMKQTEQKNHKIEIYPEINPQQYKGSEYQPIHNPFTPPEQQSLPNSPTLSQIMRDFDRK